MFQCGGFIACFIPNVLFLKEEERGVIYPSLAHKNINSMYMSTFQGTKVRWPLYNQNFLTDYVLLGPKHLELPLSPTTHICAHTLCSHLIPNPLYLSSWFTQETQNSSCSFSIFLIVVKYTYSICHFNHL